MTEPIHVEAPLSPAEDLSEAIRRGRTHSRSVPYLEHEAPDHYAPVKWYAACIDGTGYRRRRHEWLHESPAGTRCIWCGRLRLYDPWPAVPFSAVQG